MKKNGKLFGGLRSIGTILPKCSFNTSLKTFGPPNSDALMSDWKSYPDSDTATSDAICLLFLSRTKHLFVQGAFCWNSNLKVLYCNYCNRQTKLTKNAKIMSLWRTRLVQTIISQPVILPISLSTFTTYIPIKHSEVLRHTYTKASILQDNWA